MTRGRILIGQAVVTAAGFLLAALALQDAYLAQVGVTLVALELTAALVICDSDARGRRPLPWFLFALFLAPVGLPVFLLVAVVDRLWGRPGLESSIPDRLLRAALVGAALLSVAAGVMVLHPLRVPDVSVRSPHSATTFSGSCGDALEAALDEGSAQPEPVFANDPAASLVARSDVARRCAVTGGRWLEGGGLCLLAAVALASAAAVRAGRRPGDRARRRQPGLAAGPAAVGGPGEPGYDTRLTPYAGTPSISRSPT